MSDIEGFLKDSEKKVFNLEHRARINKNMSSYHTAVEAGLEQFSDYELARERASYLKTFAIDRLDEYLVAFESNFKKRGGKVIWAQNKEEALKEILKIFKRKDASMTVKSKSMTTEELELNECLEHNGIEAVETDLGEFIVQLAGEKPYHIVTPAMHMSVQDISDLFVKKLGTEPTTDAQKLTLIARKLLREKYVSADIGITGGNFLIADIGGIAITENEGNARLSTTFPKTHIAVVGIEKIIASVTDLDLFWPLLATSGTGQQISVYNTILSGPRQPGELDGPDEMYVILLDNGRTKLLADDIKRQALNCIRCGACLNACPVYKNIGGHSYNTPYSGPIGAVITPQMHGMEKYAHLSYASSLCGACTSVCPVKIDLHNLLLLNRKQNVDEKRVSNQEVRGIRFWKMAMLNRKIFNLLNGKIKTFILNYLFKDTWGKRRAMPELPSKSFQQQWVAKKKMDNSN